MANVNDDIVAAFSSYLFDGGEPWEAFYAWQQSHGTSDELAEILEANMGLGAYADNLAATFATVADLFATANVRLAVGAGFHPLNRQTVTDVVFERGDTTDGAYIAPSSLGGLAVFMPNRVATTGTFQLADDAAIEIAGDIRIEVQATLPKWDGFGTEQAFVTKWLTTSTKSWAFALNTAGTPTIFASPDGTTTGSSHASSGGPLAFADNATWWVAVELDADDGAGQNVATYYTSTDGETWTLQGSATVAGTTSIHNNDSPIQIGRLYLNTWETLGLVHRVRIYSGIGGSASLVAECYPTRDAAVGDTDWVDATSGLTWALQTTAAQTDWPTLVGNQLVFDGADFLATSYTPTFTPTTGALTVLVVMTPAVTVAQSRVYSSESANNNGSQLVRTTADTTYLGRIGGATTFTVTADQTVTVGTRTLLAHVIDNGVQRLYQNGVGFTVDDDITGVGTITHVPIEIGARANDDSNPWTGSIQDGGFLIFESALTEAQLDALSAMFGV